MQLACVDRLLHGPQIGFGIILAENVIKAALRQTHVQRHLSAFKAVDADAGTRLRALLSATSSLALARADAPPDTHAALASACIISEFVEFHVLALAFRSEEHTSELQSLMRISYAVFCLKKKNKKTSVTHQYRPYYLY